MGSPIVPSHSPIVPSHSLRRQSSDLQAAACEEHRWDEIPARPWPDTKIGTPKPEAKMGSDQCPLHERVHFQQLLDNAKDELHAARNVISHLERQAAQSYWDRFFEQAVCCRRPTRCVSELHQQK